MNGLHSHYAYVVSLILWVCLPLATGCQEAKNDQAEQATPVPERSRSAAIRHLGAMTDNLLDTVHGFLYEQALTKHRQEQYRGNLAEIKKRGVLRVAMLNNSIAYFIYRGQQVGFQFEMMELLAKRLDVRLEVVVPKVPKDLTRLLVEDRADLVVNSKVQADPFGDQVAYSQAIAFSNQALVQPAGEKPIVLLSDLMNRSLTVRHSSQYYQTLKPFTWMAPGFSLLRADEDLETEDLIDLVGQKKIALTIANTALLAVEMTYRDDIQGTLVLAEKKPLGLAVRKDAGQLLARINRFIEEDCRGAWYRALRHKYFSKRKRMIEVRSQAMARSGAISPFDHLARKYGRKYAVDWRLVLAQMYQESRFDPQALSWAGAQGLLQVMPATGKEMGFVKLYDPEQNVHAGVKYLARLLARIDTSLPMRQRIRFALAAYNVGLGHVYDARRLARKQGLDPDRWFGQVEQAMLLLEKPRYYQRARHGYCRGSEPVIYLSRVQAKYDAYVALMPAAGK